MRINLYRVELKRIYKFWGRFSAQRQLGSACFACALNNCPRNIQYGIKHRFAAMMYAFCRTKRKCMVLLWNRNTPQWAYFGCQRGRRPPCLCVCRHLVALYGYCRSKYTQVLTAVGTMSQKAIDYTASRSWSVTTAKKRGVWPHVSRAWMLAPAPTSTSMTSTWLCHAAK